MAMAAARSQEQAAAEPLSITPAQALTLLREELGLTDAELGAVLGAAPRTLTRWRAGLAHPQHAARAGLVRLLRLRERLQATFRGPASARGWLHLPNPYLGELTPAEALRAGRLDRVEAALGVFAEGMVI